MAGGMLQAADAGVRTGVRNDTGPGQSERWLGCAGSARPKISRAGFGTPAERATIKAHFRQMAEEPPVTYAVKSHRLHRDAMPVAFERRRTEAARSPRP